MLLTPAVRVHAFEVRLPRAHVHLEECAVVAVDTALDWAVHLNTPHEVRPVLARLDVERADVTVDLLDDGQRLVVDVLVPFFYDVRLHPRQRPLLPRCRVGRTVDDIVATRRVLHERAVAFPNVPKAKHRDHAGHYPLLLAIVLVGNHPEGVVLEELLRVVHSEVAPRLVDTTVDPLAFAVVRSQDLHEVQHKIAHLKHACEDDVGENEVPGELVGRSRVEHDHVRRCREEDSVPLRHKRLDNIREVSLEFHVLLLNVHVLYSPRHFEVNVNVELAGLASLDDLVEEALVLALDTTVELDKREEATHYVGAQVSGYDRHVVSDSVNGLHCHCLWATPIAALVELVDRAIPVRGETWYKDHCFFLGCCWWRNIYAKQSDQKFRKNK